MLSLELGTQTDQVQDHNQRYFGLTGKTVLKFLSSLILPLMLGVFTIVVTFEQQKVARQQRLEDKNESLLQRQQAWDIAQKAQTTQDKAIRDRYQDEMLIAYIKELGDLLEKNSGFLTNNPLTHTLARVKTLNTIRQLDGFRKIYVLRFLKEAGQLTNKNNPSPLDISTAELTDIDFRKSGSLLSNGEIVLVNVVLDNSMFGDMDLIDVKFSSAQLENVNLSSATLNDVKFSSAQLENVNLSFATLNDVEFSSAQLENVNFSSARLNNANFSSAELNNVNFSSAQLYYVNFSSARFHNANFSSAWLDNVNFSFAQLQNVNFSSTGLFKVNFSSADFPSNLGPTSFDHSTLLFAVFDKCDLQKTDFAYADLEGSSFHSSNISSVNFSHANLQNANFINTTTTDSQLQSALSIRNAQLPNGTLGQGRNLIGNGGAHCNISILDHWRIWNGSIAVTTSNNDQSQCRFSLQSATNGATMSQQIKLIDIWDSSFWGRSDVELRAQMSSGISIELSGQNSYGKVFDKAILTSTKNEISMHLSAKMEVVVVMVTFTAQLDQNDMGSSWCDNIELFLNYGRWQW